MANLAPIALADLGAGLDAALDAAALNPGGEPAYMFAAPPLLVACGRVTGAVAGLRLYRHDGDLGRWVPSAVAVASVNPATDAGVFELRFNTAAVTGYYALVQESGAGVVEYVFRPGRN